jgi:hypothetical protein
LVFLHIYEYGGGKFTGVVEGSSTVGFNLIFHGLAADILIVIIMY